MEHKSFLKRIASDPEICHGKPCIKGTRIPVYLIVSLVAEGENTESIQPEDIKAAIQYAATLCEYEAYAI